MRGTFFEIDFTLHSHTAVVDNGHVPVHNGGGLLQPGTSTSCPLLLHALFRLPRVQSHACSQNQAAPPLCQIWRHGGLHLRLHGEWLHQYGLRPRLFQLLRNLDALLEPHLE